MICDFEGGAVLGPEDAGGCAGFEPAPQGFPNDDSLLTKEAPARRRADFWKVCVKARFPGGQVAHLQMFLPFSMSSAEALELLWERARIWLGATVLGGSAVPWTGGKREEIGVKS